MKTNKLINCPQCGGFGFTSTPVSTDYEITVCRAKTCELCHGSGVIEAPMTNADRIRAMSDEELVNVVPCPLGFSMLRCPIERQCGPCKREWLKQPAKEDDHD